MWFHQKLQKVQLFSFAYPYVLFLTNTKKLFQTKMACAEREKAVSAGLRWNHIYLSSSTSTIRITVTCNTKHWTGCVGFCTFLAKLKCFGIERIPANPPDFPERLPFFTAVSWCPAEFPYLSFFPDLLLCHRTCFLYGNGTACTSFSTLKVYRFHPDNYTDAPGTSHEPKGALLISSPLEENSIQKRSSFPVTVT